MGTSSAPSAPPWPMSLRQLPGLDLNPMAPARQGPSRTASSRPARPGCRRPLHPGGPALPAVAAAPARSREPAHRAGHEADRRPARSGRHAGQGRAGSCGPKRSARPGSPASRAPRTSRVTGHPAHRAADGRGAEVRDHDPCPHGAVPAPGPGQHAGPAGAGLRPGHRAHRAPRRPLRLGERLRPGAGPTGSARGCTCEARPRAAPGRGTHGDSRAAARDSACPGRAQLGRGRLTGRAGWPARGPARRRTPGWPGRRCR